MALTLLAISIYLIYKDKYLAGIIIYPLIFFV